MNVYVVIARRPSKENDSNVTEVFTYTDYGKAHDMLTRLLNQHGFHYGFVETCELITE